MYCRRCQKEIVVVGISHGAASGEDIDAIRRSIENEGKLPLFNPPPVGPHHCPECHQELVAADSGSDAR
jgi:hypothetical protein